MILLSSWGEEPTLSLWNAFDILYNLIKKKHFYVCQLILECVQNCIDIQINSQLYLQTFWMTVLCRLDSHDCFILLPRAKTKDFSSGDLFTAFTISLYTIHITKGEWSFITDEWIDVRILDISTVDKGSASSLFLTIVGIYID